MGPVVFLVLPRGQMNVNFCFPRALAAPASTATAPAPRQLDDDLSDEVDRKVELLSDSDES